MKKILVSATLLFTIFVNGLGQPAIPKENLLVQNKVNALFQGLAELDPQKIRQSCSPDIKNIPKAEKYGHWTH